MAATGFIPKDFVPPLKVTFTQIWGDDIDPDPITGICPPTTRSQAELIATFNKTMSFKPDLFLVLTRQEVLGAEPVNAARSFAVPLAALLLLWLSAAFS